MLNRPAQKVTQTSDFMDMDMFKCLWVKQGWINLKYEYKNHISHVFKDVDNKKKLRVTNSRLKVKLGSQ